VLLDPLKIFRDLPQGIQNRLRASVGADLEKNAEDILANSNQSAAAERLSDGLAIIGVLTDEDAQRLVLDALSDAGFDAADLETLDTELIRAAELYLHSAQSAEDAARYWAANKRYWSKSQMSAFLVACNEPLTDELLDYAKQHQGIIEAVIQQYFRSSRILSIQWHIRPATGLDFRAGSILQIDIKRSNAAKLVEIERDGQPAKVNLKFVSDITLLINPGSSEIAVISESGGLKFRRELAEAANQLLFRRSGVLEEIRPRKISLSSLRERPLFDIEHADIIRSAHVSGLAFRRSGQGGIRTFLRADEGADVYEAAELNGSSPLLSIYEAFIELEFAAAFRTSPTRQRRAELREPSFQSFPHFTHDERLLALELFVRMGWMDAEVAHATNLPLEELDRISQPVPLAEAEAMFGASVVKNLLDAEILKKSGARQFAWCPLCLKTHPVSDPLVLSCRYETRKVEQSELNSCKFDADRTARWLCKNLIGKSSAPRLLYNGVWHIGRFSSPDLPRPAEIVFASRLRHADTLSQLNRHLLSLNDNGTGLVIGVDPRELDRTLGGGWTLIGLSDFVRTEPGGLKLQISSVVNHVLGRVPAARKQPMDVADFLEKVDSETSGNKPYPVVRTLRAANPGRWALGERQLVNLLHRHRPERFPKSE